MNDSNSMYYDPLYKDNTKKHISIALGFLLLLVLIGTFYFIKKDTSVSSGGAPSANTTEEVEKLSNAFEVSIQGYLLVDTYHLQSDGSYESSTVTQISLNNDLESRILTQNSATSNLSPNSPTTGAAVQYDAENDMYKAISYNIDTGVYTSLPSPEGYSINRMFSSITPWYLGDGFSKEIYGTVDQEDLQYWRVMAGNTETQEFVIEDGATSPRWIEDGVDMVFIKNDGIYQYNISTQITERIFGGYTNLSGYSELAISSGGEYIVVTMPRNNIIGILHKGDTDDTLYSEIARIESPSAKSISPIFDPSGRFFAVIEKEINTNQSSVVVYSALLMKELKRIPLGDTVSIATLSAWTQIPTKVISNLE